MFHTLIKICGISDIEVAKQTALAGADFIGLIFHPSSRHHVNLDEASKISHILKENGATPVAIFITQTADKMQHICQTTDIQVVQLHGDSPKSTHHLLPENFQRIYVRSVNLDGTFQEDSENGLEYCYPERDLLSFDSSHGQGLTFDWEQFQNHNKFRWFLAGGLNAQNVSSAIQMLNPTGVDVSSGVEAKNGEKNIGFIQQFIQSVRGI